MRGQTRTAVSILLGLLGLGLMFAVTGRLGDGRYAVAGDAHYIYATARSLAFDGDLDLSNQLRGMGDPWGLGRDPAVDGWRFPPREIGPALLMVPGLWLHHALGLPSWWAPSFSVLLPSLSLGALFWLCVGISEAVGAPRRAWSHGVVATAATLGFVVPYYVVGRTGYAHAPDAVVCAALTLALIRRTDATRVGLLLAAAVLFRLQNCLWLAWPLFELVRARGAAGAERPLRIAGLGLLGLAPAAWLAIRHPGSSQGAIRWGLDFFDLDRFPADLLGVLVGGHGLLSWTPIAALSVVGLVVAWGWGWRTRAEEGARSVAGAAVCVLALELLLVAAVRDPAGGWAFGARRLAGMTGIVGLGVALAASTRWVRVRPRTFAGTVLALTAINLAVTALALTGRISLAP